MSQSKSNYVYNTDVLPVTLPMQSNCNAINSIAHTHVPTQLFLLMFPFTLATEITYKIKEYILINNQDNNKCLASIACSILRHRFFFGARSNI